MTAQRWRDQVVAKPPVGEIVWVIEDFYLEGVGLGLFDGVVWRLCPSGSDDCQVSFWMPLAYPEPPEEWTNE